MSLSPNPRLRFLHRDHTLNRLKLDAIRRLPTAELLDSLIPGRPGSLKARADGTVLDGHHRLCVLQERGIDINVLPREIVPRSIMEADG